MTQPNQPKRDKMNHDDLIALRARIDEIENTLQLKGKLYVHGVVMDKFDDAVSIDPAFLEARLEVLKKAYEEATE